LREVGFEQCGVAVQGVEKRRKGYDFGIYTAAQFPHLWVAGLIGSEIGEQLPLVVQDIGNNLPQLLLCHIRSILDRERLPPVRLGLDGQFGVLVRNVEAAELFSFQQGDLLSVN